MDPQGEGGAGVRRARAGEPALRLHESGARQLLLRSRQRRRGRGPLHDSDHRYGNERFELEAAVATGVPVLLSDHSQESTALADVCREHGGRYAFIREVPRDHFYPGGGIGAGIFGAGEAGT